MTAYTRAGTGAPLVLLHGIGGDRHAWDPVIGPLAERFDVIAVDLPGHGESDPLPAHVEPSPEALASAVAGLLDDLNVTTPHLAGNSLGGWVALELAAIRPVASLALLSPAGLWRGRTPVFNRVSLRTIRTLARYGRRPLCRLVRYPPARRLVFAQTHGRPARFTADYARRAVLAMGTCPAFDATMAATVPRRYVAGPAIDAPVTVAFGTRDRVLLRRRSRHVDQLPPGTRVETLRGCGHVPMGDDPPAVATFIVRAAERAGRSRAR
ncbi:alpha/beta fold hydrolase [Virgisporangium aurantiacum]|uniref:Hydrolase n=1 Tax=Virgisporangium aurantiacum TaxID=175570 RepID=A0A8J4E3M9_9ACTN|nr:alpha/beta fold hydrolase [Virgisporangium aurantiacum]GIJ60118.1 hydrolase [Virgisporangium aurantiacum]